MKNKIIKELYRLANKAYKNNEIPVSALIVSNGKIISKAYNKKNISKCALYHAEVLCIKKATKKLHRWNLSDCELYVTLEPCNMCKELIEESRISRVNYVLEKGNITNKYNNTLYEQVYGDNEIEFENLMQKTFKNIRK